MLEKEMLGWNKVIDDCIAQLSRKQSKATKRGQLVPCVWPGGHASSVSNNIRCPCPGTMAGNWTEFLDLFHRQLGIKRDSKDFGIHTLIGNAGLMPFLYLLYLLLDDNFLNCSTNKINVSGLWEHIVRDCVELKVAVSI